MKTPLLQLLGLRVLVAIEDDRAKGMTEAPGHILLPDEVARDTTIGTVVGLGDGRYNDAGDKGRFDVKLGDRVKLSPHAVFEYFEGDTEYRVVSHQDIVGILPTEKGDRR